MSKYASDTLSGRIEEALRFLGMSGPLSLSEDALEALDALHDALHLAEAELRLRERSQIPVIRGQAS